MDFSNYKKLVNSRNITYNYYVTPSSSSVDVTKPTILFAHGFPSLSTDWEAEVSFFEKNGYRVIAPDMLGYGGTDKPLDVQPYQAKLLAKDLIDILDAEKVDKVVVIGHDWGSMITSRLAILYPERFIGFGFLAVSYTPPSPQLDFNALYEKLTGLFGYFPYGYWQFLAEDDAPALIERNWESVKSLLFPQDPSIWKTDLGPIGAAKAYVARNEIRPKPDYITQEFSERFDKSFGNGGITPALNYYKAVLSGIMFAGDKEIPQERYVITKPVFYGAALQDYAAHPIIGKGRTNELCKGPTTVKEYDSSHWVILSHAEQLNKDLLEWVQSLF